MPTPASCSTGIRCCANCSCCSRDSQTSLTRRLPLDPKQTCASSPSGGQCPSSCNFLPTLSYCSDDMPLGVNLMSIAMDSSSVGVCATLRPRRSTRYSPSHSLSIGGERPPRGRVGSLDPRRQDHDLDQLVLRDQH